jgi:hypothetical protein
MDLLALSYTFTLNYTYIQQYSAIADLHHLQHTVAHALGFSVYISRLPATALNTEDTTVSPFNVTHKILNSHVPLFSNYEPSTVVSHLELTDNYSRNSFNLSYKPLI